MVETLDARPGGRPQLAGPRSVEAGDVAGSQDRARVGEELSVRVAPEFGVFAEDFGDLGRVAGRDRESKGSQRSLDAFAEFGSRTAGIGVVGFERSVSITRLIE